MTAGNQPSSSGGESAFDICEMIISEEFHLDEENPPSPAIQSYGYAARDRIRAAKREVCGGGAQRQPGPVQDTYLVGGPPDLKAMSGSVESDRVIQLHFRRKATDDDRKWLLEAINEKLATDSAVTPSPAQPPRTPLDLSAGELNTLATDAFREGSQGSAVAWIGEYDGHLDTTIYRDTMERWKALGRKITPLYAVTPSPGPGGWTPDQFWEYVGGLAGEFEAGQMRDMLAARWLSITSTHRSPPAATAGDIPSGSRPPASAAMGLSAGGEPTYIWPAGCHSPNSCHRNKRCMYVGCRHDGTDAMTSTTSGGAAK